MSTAQHAWEEGFIDRLEAALPVDNIVAWLLVEYPNCTERDVMAMLQRVYQRNYHITPSASEERDFLVGGQSWRAVPQRVAAGK